MSGRMPIFALHSVLCPGGEIDLQVFEPRYLDMVSACLRSDRPWGVCMIRRGQEVGPAAEIYPLGTRAEVVDWNPLPNGLLGLRLRGGTRFRAGAIENDARQLLSCEPEWFEDEVTAGLRPSDTPLSDLLVTLARHPAARLSLEQGKMQDAAWVSWRLLERLPVPLEAKQELLALDHPWARLDAIQEILGRLS